MDRAPDYGSGGYRFDPYGACHVSKVFFMSVEVKIRKGESVEKGLRRLKRKLLAEDIINQVRERRYFTKPAQVRRRKKQVADFNNMLRERYRNM